MGYSLGFLQVRCCARLHVPIIFNSSATATVLSVVCLLGGTGGGGGGRTDTGTTRKVTNCSGNGRGEAQTDLPNLCAFHVVLPPRSPCSSAEPSKTERINPESCRQAYS